MRTTEQIAAGLKSQLTLAGLPVRIVEKQSQVNRSFRNSGRAFLMDIVRKPKEEFRIFVGDGEAEITNVDRQLQQAVMTVHEPESTIVRREWDGKQFVTRRITVPGGVRHTLIGMDECHLFAAPLPKPVTTVREAHRILMPEAVARERGKGKVIRQGEWFFTKVDSTSELQEIEKHVRAVGIKKKTMLGSGLIRRGRPHIADEVVIFNPIGLLKDRREYARGCIRHPDHHVRKLKGWHRVNGNTETGGGIAGMTWVD